MATITGMKLGLRAVVLVAVVVMTGLAWVPLPGGTMKP